VWSWVHVKGTQTLEELLPTMRAIVILVYVKDIAHVGMSIDTMMTLKDVD
jgi:hypothetical protein